jgi:serine/threonine protein kinase
MIIAKQVKQDIVINEIMIMKESHHPSIVNYIDSYIVDGTLWVWLIELFLCHINTCSRL